VTDGRTDGRTDGQTDRIAIAKTRYSIAAFARKNVDSHNVEVIMSKNQNVDNGNGESQNVESVTHTRFRKPGPICVRNLIDNYAHTEIGHFLRGIAHDVEIHI